MNPLLEGALGGALIALMLMPVIYFSIRKRGENAGDHIQLTALSGKGINLEKPREVDFALFVRTEASANHIAAQLESEGYVVRHEPGKIEIRSKSSTPATTEEGRLIVATKVVVLYGDTLGTVRARFSSLAEKENGVYVGWQAKDLSP